MLDGYSLTSVDFERTARLHMGRNQTRDPEWSGREACQKGEDDLNLKPESFFKHIDTTV